MLGVGPGELTEEQAQAVLDAAQAGRSGRPQGLRRRLRRPAALQARHRRQRRDRDRGGDRDPALRLRHGDGDGRCRSSLGDPRPRLLALDHPPARATSSEVPSVASTLATMIGLGVGIDYALFIVTRHKLQLGDGMELRESIARATATAGRRRRLRRLHGRDRALLARLRRHPAGQHARASRPRSRSVVAVARARPRCCRRCSVRSAAGSTRCACSSARRHPDDAEPHGWRRWAAGGRRPAVALGDRAPSRSWSCSPLPVFQLELGQNDLSALPKSTTARQAYDALTQGFGPGVNGPLLIASEFESRRSRSRSEVADPACEPRRSSGAPTSTVGRRTDARRSGHRLPSSPSSRTRRPGPTQTVEPGRRPARHDDPEGPEGHRRRPPTSAARPPATSTSPRRSPTSCR